MARFRETIYNAEASNIEGRSITGGGFADGAEAKRWAIEMMPDVSLLVLKTPQGQSRGRYTRRGGSGLWEDADMWGKSR